MNNTSDATASFTYGKTADSTIGVATSSNGTSNWFLDGSAQISNSNSGSVKIHRNPGVWADSGYELETKFTYQKTEFSSACGDTTNFPTYYQVSPTQWDGSFVVGSYVGAADDHPNCYINNYAPGTSFTCDTNSAHTYNAAVNVFGASLTSQSGFSTNVQEHWSFSSGAGHDQILYGNNDFPTRSGIIYTAD